MAESSKAKVGHTGNSGIDTPKVAKSISDRLASIIKYAVIISLIVGGYVAWKLRSRLPRYVEIWQCRQYNNLRRWSWGFDPYAFKPKSIGWWERFKNFTSRSRFKGCVCIVGRYDQFLMATELLLCSPPYNSNVVGKKVVSYTKKNESVAEDFFGAEKIIFVAAAEPRLLIINDQEESQLGEAYATAEKLVTRKNIFLILAGHLPSNKLKPSESFDGKALEDMLPTQPKIVTERFISVGTQHQEGPLQLNQSQELKLKKFLEVGTEIL